MLGDILVVSVLMLLPQEGSNVSKNRQSKREKIFFIGFLLGSDIYIIL